MRPSTHCLSMRPGQCLGRYLPAMAVTDLLRAVPDRASKLATRIGHELYYANVCREAGIIHVEAPHKTARTLKALATWGPIGGALASAAARSPQRVAIIDDRGSMTYAELDGAVNALANHWLARGFKAGDGLALLARNHRGFLIAMFAGAKIGARIVLLNTDFAGPQIREVADREGTDLLVHDDEYSAFLDGLEPRLGRLRAWTDEPADDTIDAIVARGSKTAPPRAGSPAKLIVLTSGTTGTPKGAPRSTPKSLIAPGVAVQQGPVPRAAGHRHRSPALPRARPRARRRRCRPRLAPSCCDGSSIP